MFEINSRDQASQNSEEKEDAEESDAYEKEQIGSLIAKEMEEIRRDIEPCIEEEEEHSGDAVCNSLFAELEHNRSEG